MIVRYADRHDPNSTANVEWVYNAANIDAAPVVWARDMGSRENAELIDYFRGRKVWLIEPDSKPLDIQPYPLSQH